MATDSNEAELEEQPRRPGTFKRFFSWVNRKVCATGRQNQDANVTIDSTRPLSQPRSGNHSNLDGTKSNDSDKKSQEDARIR